MPSTSTPMPCHLCGAARITTGQNVCDGSFPFECGSVIRPMGRAPEVRVIGDRCARWARDIKHAVDVMDTNYREMSTSAAEARAEGERAATTRIADELRSTAREVAEGSAGMSASQWLDCMADGLEATVKSPRGEHQEAST